MKTLSQKLHTFFKRARALAKTNAQLIVPPMSVKYMAERLSADEALLAHAHYLLDHGHFIRLVNLIHALDQFKQTGDKTLSDKLAQAFQDESIKSAGLQSLFFEYWQAQMVHLFYQHGLPRNKTQALQDTLKLLWDKVIADLRRKGIDNQTLARLGSATGNATLFTFMFNGLTGIKIPLEWAAGAYSAARYTWFALKHESLRVPFLTVPNLLKPEMFELLFNHFQGAEVGAAKAVLTHLSKQTQAFAIGVDNADSMNGALRGVVSTALVYGLCSALPLANAGIVMRMVCGFGMAIAQRQVTKRVTMNTEAHPMQPALNVAKQTLGVPAPLTP